MKPLTALNNVEKAKLLHSLFPDEIPAFLQFVEGMNHTLAEEQEAIKDKWDNQLFAFDLWLSLSGDTGRIIRKYGRQLEKSGNLFADQLFDGYNALYLAHCLIQYITLQKQPDEKFGLAVNLLFA